MRQKKKMGQKKKIAVATKDQRRIYNKGNLSKERIDALVDIGFVWDPLEFAWRLRFEELKAYKQENGHCNVPQRSEGKLGKWVKLGMWVHNQRSLYKADNLSKERIDALHEIGFVWELG